MTEISFHLNAPDRLAHACRVARKLLREDKRLVMLVPPELLDPLDDLLWNMAPQDFVAHCRATDARELLQASSIVLTQDVLDVPHQEVLLNLCDEVPQDFSGFERLIEIVSANDESDRIKARVRWKDYQQRGYKLQRHDLAAGARA
ncbi:MAG: DNA polymerase III subunit chi [Giesbergeria sp.]